MNGCILKVSLFFHELIKYDDSFFVLASVSPAGNIQYSRSGRLIKPPLDYWRGGRVILDSDMKVTIHEDYAATAELLLVIGYC